MSRVHTSAGVIDGPRDARVDVVTNWTPGTPIAQVEEAIKAASRSAVTAARERHRADAQAPGASQ